MFQKIDPKELTCNPFTLIGQKWMLITAGTPDNCNTMTASWGGVGIMWGSPVATCYIRPQRHTKTFVDNSEYLTLSFFGEEYRDQLGYCGSHSGRDVNKFEQCGFTVAGAACGAPYIEQAELVLVCKKQYAQPMGAEFLLDGGAVDKRWYPNHDWHMMYISQIVEVYQKV